MFSLAYDLVALCSVRALIPEPRVHQSSMWQLLVLCSEE